MLCRPCLSNHFFRCTLQPRVKVPKRFAQFASAMNTDNKIAVSDKRELRKTLSGGVRDLSQVGHFPALTAAQAPSVGARKLQRMSSSFKDVVRTETEAQELPVILEASADSTAVPSGSPRIGVRYQQAALEQQQDEQSFRPKQFRPSVSSKADVDEEGFQTPRSRKTRSPKATVDVDAQPAIQTSFGIPAHDNTFSLLADSRSRTTTSGSEVNIAAMADSASESVHSADGAEALSTSFEPRDALPFWWCETSDLLAETCEVESPPMGDNGSRNKPFRLSRQGGILGSAVHGVGCFVKDHPRATAVVAVAAVGALRFLLSRRRR